MNQRAGRALFLHTLNLNRNTDKNANNLRRRYDSSLRQVPKETPAQQPDQAAKLRAQNQELRAKIKRLEAEQGKKK
jgi:cell division protein FtsB